MGSGISRIYSNTIQESQPYSKTYRVVKELFEEDKKDPDIYDSISGYFKNPTATDLEESIIDNRIFIGKKRAHGVMTYVMNEEGKIIFGIRKNPNNAEKRAPHPTLIGEKNPKVKCAGMITFSKGRIVSIDNKSGHFRPNIKSMVVVDAFMDRLFKDRPEVFDSKSKWRKK